jgi:steroid delta-isomerase-like uncharacterized protein
MTRTLLGAVLVGAVALGGMGCKSDDKQPARPAPKPAVKKEPPPPKDLTPDERVAFYRACWDAFNNKDEAKFGPCWAENAEAGVVDGPPRVQGRAKIMSELVKQWWTAFPDAKGTPQLTLVNGMNIASVEHFAGTNTGPLMGMEPSGKKVGYLMLHSFEGTGPGPVAKGHAYIDMATMMAQLGHSPAPARAVSEAGESIVAIAKDDATEAANLEAMQKGIELFNAHNAKGLMAMYADDAVFSDQTMPMDLVGRKDITKGLEGFYKAFPDIKSETVSKWAAGEYTVHFSRLTGTNKGPMPEMGLKKPTGKTVQLQGAEVFQWKDGKVARQWLFANGMAFAIQMGMMPDPMAAPPGEKKDVQ